MEEQNKKKVSSLTQNTILLSIGSLLTKGLSFFLVPLYSKWLTVSDYGSFDLMGTYISLLIPFITLSSGEAIFRFCVDNDEDDLKKAYVTNGFLILFLNLILVILILLAGNIYVKSITILPFICLLIGELINNHLQSYLRATKRLNIYSLSSVITTLGFAIFVTLFVKIFNFGLNGMLYGYALGYMLGNAVIFIWSKYWKTFSLKKISVKSMKEMIQYSIGLIPNSISWWIINVSDRMIIKYILGTVYNGIYAIAYKIPNLCTSIFGTFSISWQEKASTMKEEEKEEYFNKVYNKLIAIIISLCCGIFSCNFIFFNYLFDVKYYEAHLYAPILVASIAFQTMSQFFGGIQISLKRPKENGKSTVIGAVSNIVINLALIKFVGLYAAALSTLLSNMIVSIIRKIKIKDKYKFKIINKNYINVVIFCYFMIMSYIIQNLYLNIFNLFIACVFFAYINKEMVFRILNSIKRKVFKGI